MADIESDELYKYNAYHSATGGYYSGYAFPSGAFIAPIKLKKFTEIAPSVIARLRYLEDFTPTLSTEETSSTAAPASNPNA